MGTIDIRKELMDDHLNYFVKFKFTRVYLPDKEAELLDYIFDFMNLKGKDKNDEIELAGGFMKKFYPSAREWDDQTVRKYLKILVSKNVLIKCGNHGRGNFYRLNLDTIYSWRDGFLGKRVVDTEYQPALYQVSACLIPDIKQSDTKYKQTITIQEHNNNNNNNNNKNETNNKDNSLNETYELIDYFNNLYDANYRKKSNLKPVKSIREKLNEGFTLDQCKEYLQKMTAWKNTPYASALTLEKLFGEKFDQYYNMKFNSNNKQSVQDKVVSKAPTNIDLSNYFVCDEVF